MFSQAQVQVYQDTVKDYELQLSQAKGFYEYGKKPKLDIITAEYNLGKAKLNLVKAEEILKVAKIRLSKIMGIPSRLDFYNAILNYNVTAANLEQEIGIPLKQAEEKVIDITREDL